jgi:hypothetical protein
MKIEQRTAFLKKLLQDSGLTEYLLDTEVQRLASRTDPFYIVDLLVKLKTLALMNTLDKH